MGQDAAEGFDADVAFADHRVAVDA